MIISILGWLKVKLVILFIACFNFIHNILIKLAFLKPRGPGKSSIDETSYFFFAKSLYFLVGRYKTPDFSPPFPILIFCDAGDSKSAGIFPLKLKQPGFQDLEQEEIRSDPQGRHPPQ